MILKVPIGRSRIYDILHKGFVNTCMGMTVIALIGLTFTAISRAQHRNALKSEKNTHSEFEPEEEPEKDLKL